MKTLVLFLSILLVCICHIAKAQDIYFPTGTWETVTPETAGFKTSGLPGLHDFLDSTKAKAFIILYKGRIVDEKYFGDFAANKLWYWASAGKTLTAFLIGQGIEAGYFKQDDPISKYLGNGWSSMTKAQEDAITIQHLLTMTSGMDDKATADNTCKDTACLKYLAPPGTRWAYHSGAYALLHNVIEAASGKTMVSYTNTMLFQKMTGMQGFWAQDVFTSYPRSMAMFGLLMLAEGNWNGQQLVKKEWMQSMATTSQVYNKSYGLLTWLNGKDSYRLPGFQVNFPGNLVPSAPADAYAALGKNDQKIYVVPSQDLVIIRMGDAADSSLFATSAFDEKMWQRINSIRTSSSIRTAQENNDYIVSYYQADESLHFSCAENIKEVVIYNSIGQSIISKYTIPGNNYSITLPANMAGQVLIVKILNSHGNWQSQKIVLPSR